MSEKQIEVLEILKIALLKDCRKVNLVVGVESVACWTVIQSPFLPVR